MRYKNRDSDGAEEGVEMHSDSCGLQINVGEINVGDVSVVESRSGKDGLID